ncbi:MAG: tetratricopeptide repeat protein [Chloroherpetonaceae bacterium]|nr:tetratricopeptide repeat protein [Chloroherpetonaceae bacterium]MCS7210063.1 tetratricopeptide repeat protein [Chloroherpetonaceae bacterium]MDW8020616.1 tetratricopeptide repeat protein [Chloroherpetonaceae bacterium]MDW8464996.1 tetratricopeptide repeat protein [Chloroherpetonaceae bacterium]
MHYIALLIVALIPLAGYADDIDADKLFREGNAAYQAGDFSAALQKYRLLDSLGYQSGALYYNLGNAYYKLGTIGYAILYYEKARRLMPNDEDVLANLELAQFRTKDRVPPMPPLFLDALTVRVLDFFSLTGAAAGLLVSFYLFVAILIAHMRQLLPHRTVLLVGFYLTLTLTVLFSVVFAAKAYSDASRSDAIVLAPVLHLKSEPREEGKTIFIIHEGLKVSVLRQAGEWREVRLPNGEKGWVRASELGMI